VKEGPVIFSAPMIKPILADTKTQTRRIIKNLRVRVTRTVRGDVPFDDIYADRGVYRATLNAGGAVTIDLGDRGRLGVKPGEFHFKCPYADGDTHLGDYGNGVKQWTISPLGARLWVRETWSHDAPDLDTCRAADEDALPGTGYGPYYRATEVAPDTLKWRPSIHMPRWASRITLEITEVRVQRVQDITDADAEAEGCLGGSMTYPGQAFENLWCEIYGHESWTSNPWCWCLSFRRIV
jgi:hypothetical protein